MKKARSFMGRGNLRGAIAHATKMAKSVARLFIPALAIVAVGCASETKPARPADAGNASVKESPAVGSGFGRTLPTAASSRWHGPVLAPRSRFETDPTPLSLGFEIGVGNTIASLGSAATGATGHVTGTVLEANPTSRVILVEPDEGSTVVVFPSIRARLEYPTTSTVRRLLRFCVADKPNVDWSVLKPGSRVVFDCRELSDHYIEVTNLRRAAAEAVPAVKPSSVTVAGNQGDNAGEPMRWGSLWSKSTASAITAQDARKLGAEYGEQARKAAGEITDAGDRTKAECEIAKAQASAGDIEGAMAGLTQAKATTQQITNRGLKEFAEKDIAEALARVGDTESAKATVAGITDAEIRAWAEIDIAVAMAQAGDDIGAKAAFARARAVVAGIDPRGNSPAAPPRGLPADAVVGDAAGKRAFGERDIAMAQAKVGDIEGAKATAAAITHGGVRGVAAGAIAVAQVAARAQADDIAGAKTTSAALADAAVRAWAEREIAEVQARRGDTASAKDTLAQAKATATRITPAFLRARAEREIAVAESKMQASVGDIAGAAAIAASIADAKTRAMAESEIAEAQGRAGQWEAGAKWARSTTIPGLKIARLVGLLRALQPISGVRGDDQKPEVAMESGRQPSETGKGTSDTEIRAPTKQITSGDKEANPKGEPRIDLTVELNRLDVVGTLGQSGSRLKTWDFSYAKGTYSQKLQNTSATGEIIDLGGLKLVDGKEYPFLMAQGKVFVRRSGSNRQPIEESTNGDFSIQHEEEVWRSADGNVTISQIAGSFGFVLDPQGFPEHRKVIGVADLKFVYLSLSE